MVLSLQNAYSVIVGVSNNACISVYQPIYYNRRSPLGMRVHHRTENDHRNQWNIQGVYMGVPKYSFFA